MGVEIERKFLLKNDSFFYKAVPYKVLNYKQAYLNFSNANFRKV